MKRIKKLGVFVLVTEDMFMEDFDCSLSSPIYDLLSNKTRLEILRMIACEKNYGSRLASILRISPPAVHRHLKILSQSFKDKDVDELAFLKPSYRTSESYSGYRGAEATMYEIGTKLYLAFAIYPNFVHSHAFVMPLKNGESVKSNSSQESQKETSVKETAKTKKSYNKKIRKKYSEIYDEIQRKNDEINQLEKEILEIFEEKDSLMQELDEVILEKSELDFDERVSIRALACQGPSCYPNLPELLKQDDEVVKKILRNLASDNWINLDGVNLNFKRR